jgi:hypothetical protein
MSTTIKLNVKFKLKPKTNVFDAILKKAYAELSTLPHERVVQLKPSGARAMPDRDGSINKVMFTLDEVLSNRGKEVTSLHNHFLDTSFSLSDIKKMMYGEEKLGLITSPKYNFAISADYWNRDLYDMIEPDLLKIREAIAVKYQEFVSAKKLSAAQAEIDASHEFVEIISKKYGLNYTRREK